MSNNVDNGMSPAPGVPQTPTKAVWSGVGAFVATFIVALSAATAGRDDLDSLGVRAWVIVILGALATTAVAGGLTYKVKNTAT